MVKEGGEEGVLGKYELGRTLGEGNFGKVKYARNVVTGQAFAVKILDRKRIQSLKIDDQIKREIGTLKLLKHPNVVRLHEVSASKTKIYMVLEYVNGGELFDKISLKGKLSEKEGRRLFQQLIDAVSYCHDKGVYHRDLKPENVLVDAKGNIKVSDFGLSALPQHLGNDGLLHTTCGSPNYIAPEILSNRGYDGARSDIWSCGVILYVILTGYLPFDDRNLAVLYQKIVRGDTKIPRWLSPGAQNILRRILDPNPVTRMNVAGIKADDWFKEDYAPVFPKDDDDDSYGDSFPVKEQNVSGENGASPTHINAFQLIGMSSSLDLSGFFEKEDVSERKIRFTSDHSPKELLEKIVDIVTEMGLQVQKGHGKLKVTQKQDRRSTKSAASLSLATEVFELTPSVCVVELRKSQGDSSLYRKVCARLSEDLGASKGEQLLGTKKSLTPEASSYT
ncbi:CBL-interacting protein kinase 1-like isoform X1 [Musa acuminata AAA Group]|uniref:CBL-interacting protein kinase 1-like isoform X1 n=2 Tax=Musa acuminata AAA Group TaxID=214697 RepID=UPI0031E314FF